MANIKRWSVSSADRTSALHPRQRFPHRASYLDTVFAQQPTGRPLPCSSELSSTGCPASARGKRREQPLDLRGPALRALQLSIGVRHPAQQFEALSASAAPVFVEGHVLIPL